MSDAVKDESAGMSFTNYLLTFFLDQPVYRSCEGKLKTKKGDWEGGHKDNKILDI